MCINYNVNRFMSYSCLRFDFKMNVSHFYLYFTVLQFSLLYYRIYKSTSTGTQRSEQTVLIHTRLLLKELTDQGLLSVPFQLHLFATLLH